MKRNSLWTLARLASLPLALSLSACQNPSQSEMAAWESLAEEALMADVQAPAKTDIYEPWADTENLPQPGVAYDMGDTIGQEIARSRKVLSWQSHQGAPNSYPSFQPARFAVEISRSAWDLALRGYQYDMPEAAPVAPVALASVPSQGGVQAPLILAGVPVATLKALEANYQADQGPRPDCLHILGRTIFNYCSIDTMAQACFGRTCQYFDIPREQGIELNAGFDSLVGQRHPRDGGHPIRADRSRYATGSYSIPLAVSLAPNTPPPAPQAQPSAQPVTAPPGVPAGPVAGPAAGPVASPPASPPGGTPISDEEKANWDKEPLFTPAQ